jgi:hypothetical protein
MQLESVDHAQATAQRLERMIVEREADCVSSHIITGKASHSITHAYV